MPTPNGNGTNGHVGRVVQIIGPVVDVEFTENYLPPIYEALLITSDGFDVPEPINVIAEVQQHLGEGRVRCIAMSATDGMVRGMKAIDQGGPISVPVGRGTLANWIIRPAELHYSRLYEAMRQTLLSQPLIHGDETTVQVLKEEGKTPQSTSYMWTYRSAADSEQPVVLFDYQPGRGQQYPQVFLSGYDGMLMTDGYSAWRTLEGVTHFGCMAHSRRLFLDAHKGQKKKAGGRALQALEYFKALYQVETLARAELPDDEARADYTYRLRQEHSVPLLEAFKAWLDTQAPQVLPESLLGKAISYTINQWEYLSRYVIDGRAPVDNNILERDIRPFAIARSFCPCRAGSRGPLSLAPAVWAPRQG